MRRPSRAAIALTTLVLLAACGSDDGGSADDGGSGADGPLVVVSTNILGDIAANVAGDTADVVTLMPPGVDPHDLALSAAQVAEMTKADLLIVNGLGLEASIESNIDAARDEGVTVLEIGPQVDPMPFTTGEEEGEPDPHVWTDPDRMATAARVIGDALAEVVGSAAAATVTANADAYAAQIEATAAQMDATLTPVPPERRKLVTNHEVFGYFAQRFDFEVVGAVIPSGTTLASPSSSDLAELADTIREAGVPAIFADSSQPDRLAEVLAEETDIDVRVVDLYTESLGPEGSGADTYLGMLTTDATIIADALS